MKHLHIISFDIPYPANYGGAIDVFFRIKALHKNGIKIILHCWHKEDRYPQQELEILCEKVYYYKRNEKFTNQLKTTPYAVLSRKSNDLIQNLLKDDYPILFEGLVSCYYLTDKRLNKRIKLFRECNVEHGYYRELAKATTKIKDKIYFYFESIKLKYYEKILHQADYILALSHNDEKHFIAQYPDTKIIYLPCAHTNEIVSTLEGAGNYILYHGNLAVAENEKAALYLCDNVFSKLNDIKCIIAGRNPQKNLQNKITQFKNITLIANPNEDEMSNLIQNAHIHLLITFQNTGLKLKLLNTLFCGRHIIANDAMINGSGAENLCHVANSSQQQISLCHKLMNTTFNKPEIEKRKLALNSIFSNQHQAEIITELIQH